KQLAPHASGCDVTIIAPDGVIQQMSASMVVLTQSARATAELVAPFAEALSYRVQQLPYAPVGIVHAALPEKSLPAHYRGFGFLAPPHPHRALLGTIFSSTVFDNRAPRGFELLTCFSGGAANAHAADVTQPDVATRVLSDVQSILGIETRPRLLRATFHPQAIPNYPLGHHDLQGEIEAFHATQPRVRLLANWISGLSVADRIERAEAMADRVVSELS
ncbi:MAG: protoporphyrinogen oxidase, partial [Bdellovibrionales bacterium]|nr:protoporphyrinogen oxidase [Bdellovibrionales bacterium]